MKSNADKNNRLYEKPSFNKYGTMKEITYGTGGTQGDGMMGMVPDTSDTNTDLPPQADEKIPIDIDLNGLIDSALGSQDKDVTLGDDIGNAG